MLLVIYECELTANVKCVQNGNLKQIRECLVREKDALETRDKRGNRALHLALKFAHRNSVAIVKCLMVRCCRFNHWTSVIMW